MKNLLKSIIMIMLLLAVLAGYSSNSSRQSKSKDGKITVVVMPKLVGIPYFTQTGEGAVKVGRDLGIDVIYNGPNTADDAEHMVDKMVKYMGTDSGEWAILTGVLSAENLNTWIRFGKEYAQAKYPNLRLVADPFPTDEK